MKTQASLKVRASVAVALFCLFSNFSSVGQNSKFHNAPASAKQSKNPFAGQASAAEEGSKLYSRNCGACHGAGGRGTGNVPPLNAASLKSVTDGEIFWYITRGDADNGMPSWAPLPEEQRWKIISYLRTIENSHAPAKANPASS